MIVPKYYQSKVMPSDSNSSPLLIKLSAQSPFSSKPLNSGEAVDSPASPVPPPLGLQITDTQIKLGIYSNLIGNYFAKPPVIIKNPESNTSNV